MQIHLASRKQFSKGDQADVDAQGGQSLPFDAIAVASDANRRALGQPVLLKRGALCVQHHLESSCVQTLVVRWVENIQSFNLTADNGTLSYEARQNRWRARQIVTTLT